MLCLNDLEDNIAKFIRERVPKAPMKTIFDVGANVGWFTYQTGQQFPSAQFWLFEPATPIFNEIKPLFERFPELNLQARANCYKLGLGHTRERLRMTAEPGVTINRITDADTPFPTEEVEIITGDEFCEEHKIEHIDYLKIDVEGYDLNVLIGFVKMLMKNKIRFIQVEASMDPENTLHVSIEAFSAYLENFGFKKFRIIQQASGQSPYLIRADVVFIHHDAAKAYV